MADLRMQVLELVKEYDWFVLPIRITHNEESCDGGTRNCKKLQFPAGHWSKASTNDVTEIEAWDWSWTNAFGIDCGKSGLLVPDVDPGQSWPFDGARVHRTGRGHHHIYEDVIGIAGGKALGVEVQGRGEMIIGPGSWDPHGTRKVLVDIPPPPPPPELLAALQKAVGETADDAVPLDPDAALRRLEGVYNKMAQAEDGERNNLLNWAAGKAAGIWVRVPEDDRVDELDEDHIRRRLLESIPNDGDPKKSKITIRSGWRHGVKNPVPDRAVAGGRPAVDVTSVAYALRWVKEEIGRGQLAGVLRRGTELVHTPRLGEDGYIPPKDDRDSSGPAQVRRISDIELAGRIDHGYDVIKVSPTGQVYSAVFPQPMAARAAAAPDLLPNVRELRGVTHTPVVRADGTILTEPGYDAASGLLYLPPSDLVVPVVPDRPSPGDVRAARDLLLQMVAEFPFVTVHDGANYLGVLLTPLLRPIVPPPYKLLAIGAPQRGSGKSLLAGILRQLHGGVFKSEFPTTDDELRKLITSTLDATTAPIVQIDNVSGVLKSSVFDGLLTSVDWSDRPLGRTAMVALRNDRVWVVTGNNVHIGGDLERRTLWVTINAKMERPESRTNFAIPHLESWVQEHRGGLLWAGLVLIRAWVVAGQPLGELPESTDFGRWIAALRGIFTEAGLDGVVGHEDSVRGAADPDDEEWALFLAAAYRVWGSEAWTAKDLLAEVNWSSEGKKVNRERGELLEEDLPGDIASKLMRPGGIAAKSLGKWLAFRDGRWAGGLSVQSVGDRRGSKLWRLVSSDDL